MAAKKGRSGLATLINGAGFLLAVILVLHIVFVLFGLPSENQVADSLRGAAEPLALFFPGLVQTPNPELQLILDYGLAALFWVLVSSLLARIFG